MNLRLESMWTLLPRGQLGTTCRWIEEYLRTTWGLLGDYLRTTIGLLGNNPGASWDLLVGHFGVILATWWQLFCYLWPNWNHLMNIWWLVVSYYCRSKPILPVGSNVFFSSNVYCIYDLRIESIGRKYYTQIDLHNPWTQILPRIPSCIVGPSCDFESLLWIIKSCQAIYDIPECIPGLKDKKRAISKCKIYPISGIAHK